MVMGEGRGKVTHQIQNAEDLTVGNLVSVTLAVSEKLARGSFNRKYNPRHTHMHTAAGAEFQNSHVAPNEGREECEVSSIPTSGYRS